MSVQGIRSHLNESVLKGRDQPELFWVYALRVSERCNVDGQQKVHRLNPVLVTRSDNSPYIATI
jgi:hypothetical protein